MFKLLFSLLFCALLLKVEASTKEEAQAVIDKLKSTFDSQVKSALISIEAYSSSLTSILNSAVKSSEDSINANKDRYASDVETYKEQAEIKQKNIEICLVYTDEINDLSWESIKVSEVLTKISENCQNKMKKIEKRLNSLVSVVEELTKKLEQCDNEECFGAIIEETNGGKNCVVKKVTVILEEVESVIDNGGAQMNALKDSVLKEVLVRVGVAQFKTKDCVDRKLNRS